MGEISKIQRGASPRPISDKKWYDTENKTVGWVRIGDVTNSFKFLDETEDYFSEEGIKKSRFIPKGSLIMSICATIGKPIITNMDVCIHDGFIGFSELKGINEEFLYYNLNILENKFCSLGQTGSQANLNSDLVRDTKINIPSIKEQEKIVDFLSKIDKKIELLEKKYKNKIIFKEEFFNNYISNMYDTEQKIKLDKLITISNERNKNNEDIRVLSISNKLGFISQEEQFEDRIVASSDTNNYKIVKKGYFAYNPARINVGSIARLKDYDKGIISPMYIVFKINENLLNPTFFENYLSTNYFKLEILKRLEGSVRLILSADSLKNIEITVPSLDEQNEISAFLNNLSKNINLTKKELDNFKEFKKGLLQKMFV